jgi:hypothetical protein
MPAPKQTRRSHPYELGEGRSKCIYIQPEVDDTAVLMAFYNPVPFKRILKNIRYITSCMEAVGIPVFVAECVFPGRRPQLPKADLVVHSSSYMFYKEQLLNLLEPKVPEQYTKLVFLDGDILFDAPDWLNQISVKLNHVDILQPFQEACWLTPDNTRIRNKKLSYAHAIVNGLTGQAGETHLYHPGFAWAMRRDIFRRLGGFYARSIVGNGDMMFTFNFFTDSIPASFKRDHSVSDVITDGWLSYHAQFVRVGPSLGVLGIKALHLFHGLTENRQYRTRYRDVGEHLKGTWDEIVTMNPDGLTEFRDPRASEAVLRYFKGRNEDIPLREALRTVELAAHRAKTKRAGRQGGLALASMLNQGGESVAAAAPAGAEKLESTAEPPVAI